MTSLADRKAAPDQPARAGADGTPTPAPRRYIPLLARVAGINGLLVIAAVAVTVVVLAPKKLSALALDAEVAVVLIAVVLVVLVNVYLLGKVVGPVQRLTAFARRVDFSNLAQRMPRAEPTSEAGELALTFNEMLSRLEAERMESSGRVLRAQEAERLRIAQELHDQVGQELTAVLLSLSRLSSQVPISLREDVVDVRHAARTALEDVRRIAIELRPEALDDLGLLGALAVLRERVSQQLGLKVSQRIPPDLPSLPPEHELVVYRVAQEALTNVARHSASSYAELTLDHRDGRLTLTVRDYGLGLPAHHTAGAGIRGMRERAALIGATVEIRTRGEGPGAEVQLAVPLEGEN